MGQRNGLSELEINITYRCEDKAGIRTFRFCVGILPYFDSCKFIDSFNIRVISSLRHENSFIVNNLVFMILIFRHACACMCVGVYEWATFSTKVRNWPPLENENERTGRKNL